MLPKRATDAPELDIAATIGTVEAPQDAFQATRRLWRAGALALPLPAAGDTVSRFRTLSEIAAVDLSVARLAEGHIDAIAILAEAGIEARHGLYGVWAADGHDARVTARQDATGWRLRGKKRYASGVRALDRALVTAHAPDGVRLFDVSVRMLRPVAGTWHAVGMSATDSLEVELDVDGAPVGGPGFYLARPGFWYGAIGVAACWYGGALGAYRMLRAQLTRVPPDEHQAAHLGAVWASCHTMWGVLEGAARAIDAGLDDAHLHALHVRQVVEQGCQDVLTRVGRAGGTWPLAFDPAHARRAADLIVYLRQHHAERDLAALGRAVLAEPRGARSP